MEGHSATRHLGAGLRSTGAPLAWVLTLVVFAGGLSASLVAWALGFRPSPLLRDLHQTSIGASHELPYGLLVAGKVIPAGLMAVFILVAGLAAPAGKPAFRTSCVAGLVTLAVMFLGWAVYGHPLLAGITMGLVMFLTALAVRQAPSVRALGTLLNLTYFFFGAMGFLAHVPAAKVAELAAIGAGTALVILGLVFIGRHAFDLALRIPTVPAEPPADAGASFFAPGPTMRYALLRGVLLGVLMGVVAAGKNHNVFWVLLSVWVVLLPRPDATLDRSLRRSAGVMLGCLLVAALSQVIPGGWMLWIGIAALAVGMLWMQRNYVIYQSSMSFLVVALYGDLHRQEFVGWAGRRLVDTVIGVSVALVGYWLVVLLPERFGRPSGAPPRE